MEPVPTAKRLPIIGVMGSGRDPHRTLSEPLGAWIARAGFHLLTGGGGGVMAAVSQGFQSVETRRGIALGVLPAAPSGTDAPDGYPNPWVDIPVRTHLPLSGVDGLDVQSRNAINILSADVVIALPGAAGTASEVQLAVRYEKPLILYLGPSGTIAGSCPPELPVAKDLNGVRAFVTRAIATLAPP